MSHITYKQSQDLERGTCTEEPEFYALIMAAMRRADTDNLEKLKAAWPGVWTELEQRYNAPGGYLSMEEAMKIGGFEENEVAGLPWAREGWPSDSY